MRNNLGGSGGALSSCCDSCCWGYEFCPIPLLAATESCLSDHPLHSSHLRLRRKRVETVTGRLRDDDEVETEEGGVVAGSGE